MRRAIIAGVDDSESLRFFPAAHVHQKQKHVGHLLPERTVDGTGDEVQLQVGRLLVLLGHHQGL